jgi:hypothetical protein
VCPLSPRHRTSLFCGLRRRLQIYWTSSCRQSTRSDPPTCYKMLHSLGPNQSWTLVNTLMYPSVPLDVGNFWTSWVTISFSRRTLLYWVRRVDTNTTCLSSSSFLADHMTLKDESGKLSQYSLATSCTSKIRFLTEAGHLFTTIQGPTQPHTSLSIGGPFPQG